MKTVTVDFDGTLDRADVQDYITEIMGLGHIVYIITAREPDGANEIEVIDNSDLRDVANQLGIDGDHIIYTSYEDKVEACNSVNSDLHLDDRIAENKLIDAHCPDTYTVWAESDRFRELCDGILRG